MQNPFFERKIQLLSNEKLLELIKITSHTNIQILKLATKEAKKRNLQIPAQTLVFANPVEQMIEEDQLNEWNWGAFVLSPFWVLANKLDWLLILCSIPFVNIALMFYLGISGNKLAYKRSEIKNINDFMGVQREWSTWGVRGLWLMLATTVIWFLLNFE